MDTEAGTNLVVPLVISALAYFHYRASWKPPEEKYHTFWPRFFAPAIDSLLLWPFLWVFQWLLANLHLAPPVRTLLELATFTLPYLYTVYFHGRCGQTPGKRVCKVKVVHVRGAGTSPTGRRWSARRSRWRCRSRCCSVSPPRPRPRRGGPDHGTYALLFIALAWYWAEVITMLFNPRRRAIHDFLARTVVIRTNLRERPVYHWSPRPSLGAVPPP